MTLMYDDFANNLLNVMVLITMLVQLFIYCYFSEDISRKVYLPKLFFNGKQIYFLIFLYFFKLLQSTSLNKMTINIEWNILSRQSLRKINFMMLNTQKPLEVTCHHVIIFCLPSFLKVGNVNILLSFRVIFQIFVDVLKFSNNLLESSKNVLELLKITSTALLIM